MMEKVTIWFTGLSGSGKTTIAAALKRKLALEKIPVIVLDGDEVRRSLSQDLGYSQEDREKHMMRVAQVCKIITDQGFLNIACVISPTKKIRQYARELIGNFIEVYVNCPLEVCEQRDPKHHYQRVRAQEKKEDFVGITIPYEVPENPEVVVETNTLSPEECAEKIIQFLKSTSHSNCHSNENHEPRLISSSTLPSPL